MHFDKYTNPTDRKRVEVRWLRELKGDTPPFLSRFCPTDQPGNYIPLSAYPHMLTCLHANMLLCLHAHPHMVACMHMSTC
jgi:hypothetical protein